MEKLKIGLIAGSGQFPIIFSKTAKSKGFEVHAVAFQNETGRELKNHVDSIEWLPLGQIKRIINFFKAHKINKAVMMGAIKKTRMFSDIKPDLKAISLIAGMKHTHDDGILRSFAGVLEKEGIEIESATFLLPNILAPKGCWTKRKPAKAEIADVELGWELAKEIGRLDIGQCVVVGGGSVLAVEAIDGTDETIKRGGELGRGNAIVVKVCKPNQDTRFDIPAIGIQTVRLMHDAGVKVLVIESGKAVVFDREEMIAYADKNHITILAMSRD